MHFDLGVCGGSVDHPGLADSFALVLRVECDLLLAQRFVAAQLLVIGEEVRKRDPAFAIHLVAIPLHGFFVLGVESFLQPQRVLIVDRYTGHCAVGTLSETGCFTYIVVGSNKNKVVGGGVG